MKVVITMAGEGSRFKEAGYNKEKWRLKIKDRTMFEWSMLSLKDFFEDEFVFVCRKSHDAREFVAEKCSELGIEEHKVVEIDRLTDGQASTALEAGIEISNEDAVAVYNIDTYLEEGELPREAMRSSGVIPVFEAEGERWSFVKTGEDGYAIEVAEKKRISNLASIGFYYFESFGLFNRILNSSRDEILDEYGETYIAPMYQKMIDHGLEVKVEKVDADKVHILGTPEEVKKFWPEFGEGVRED